MSDDTTQWHVQVEEGLVKVWSLDQLDAAFKAGLIDESTFVLEHGTTEWQSLGALLGIDEPAAPPPSRESPVPQSLTPMSFSPQSTSPMVSDLDDDMPVAFRSSKKRGVVVAMSLVLVAAGVALAGFKFGATASEPAPAAAAAPPPVVAAPPPVEAPKPAEPARLNDDQRRALADADKALEAKLDAQQKARAAAAPHHAHHKAFHEKSPFHNGGAPGDPLNAKL